MTRTLYNPTVAAQAKEEAKIESAISFLDILDDAVIAEKVGLPLETVRQLRSENS